MFLDFYYEEAIKYYELAHKKDEDNTGLKLKIANSYRLSRDYKSSRHWYGQALTDTTTTANPADFFHYAEVLMINKEYDEAAKWYKKFYLAAPTDSRSFTKLNSLDHLTILFRDSTAISVENLAFNTNFDELGAKYYKQGLLYLSSSKSNGLVDQDFLREEDLLDLFFVQYDSLLGWQESEPPPPPPPPFFSGNFFKKFEILFKGEEETPMLGLIRCAGHVPHVFRG